MKTMSLKIRKLLRGRRRPARRQFSQRQQQEQPVKTDDDDDTKSTIGSPSLSMDSVVTSTTLLPVSGTEETPKDLSVTSTHDSDVFAQTTATPLSSDRWATASPSTDLSGTWKPIITPKFIAEYDEYLQKCGEGIWFRKVLLSVLSLTKEVIVQRHEGRELSITGSTPIGKWERTLVASGIDPNSNKVLVPSDKKDNDDGDYNVIYTEFSDPDGDTVQVEAWWEKGGSIHKSRLRNKPRLLGGEIETSRYLEEQSSPDTHNSNGSVLLVCESVFHPPPGQAKFQKANIVWRFQRV